MATELGVYHLSDDPRAYQPIRTNNFRFLVQGLDKLLRVGGDETNENDYITNAQEVLDFSVVSFEPPHFEQSELEVQRGNSTIYFAGKPKFSSKQLVINDFAGADGKSVLEAWQSLSYDVVNDVIPDSTNYKVDAVVMEYMPDHTLVNYWELKGCWIKSLSEDAWNNESDSRKKVTAVIRYDRAIPHKPE